MPFRFSLDAVLRIRLSFEEREERKLERIVQQIAQNAQSIQQLAEEMSDTVRQRDRAFEAAESAMLLHQAYARIAELRLRSRELGQRTKELAQMRAAQLRVYELAHRDRRMLTDLYDQRRAIHDAKVARVEQASIDDSFNARHRRS